MTHTCQEGADSAPFVSVPEFFEKSSVRFGSVRLGTTHFPVRRGSACVFRTRRGSVRFGSVRFRVRFWPVPKSNVSVRFGSAGSVRFLIPSWCVHALACECSTCTSWRATRETSRSDRSGARACTINLRTKNPQTKNLQGQNARKFRTCLEMPPLKLRNLLESKPLKSRFLVRDCTILYYNMIYCTELYCTILYTVYRILHSIYYMPSTTDCIQYIMYFTLSVLYSILYTPYCTWLLYFILYFI